MGESSSVKIEPEECNFTYSENQGQRGGRNVSRGPSRFQRGYNSGNTYHPYRGNTSYNRPRYGGCYICSEKTHFARECPTKKGDNVQYFTQHGISTDSTPLPMDTDSQSMQNKDTYLTLLVSQAESSSYSLRNGQPVLGALVFDTLACAVIDSGCTRSVVGRNWLSYYQETLDEQQKNLMKTEKCSTPFRFGDGDDIK